MSDTSFDGQRITAGTELILSPASPLPPASLFTPTPKAARRVLEFFTAQINNDHTRRAYLSAARRFDAWCEARGIAQLTDVQAFHVAAFIKDLQGAFSPPTSGLSSSSMASSELRPSRRASIRRGWRVWLRLRPARPLRGPSDAEASRSRHAPGAPSKVGPGTPGGSSRSRDTCSRPW